VNKTNVWLNLNLIEYNNLKLCKTHKLTGPTCINYSFKVQLFPYIQRPPVTIQSFLQYELYNQY